MSSLFDSLSDELFQVLKGSGKTLTLYGADGNKTYEPKEARRVFATPDNIMVSVVEAGSDSEVKLYLSQSTDVKAMSRLINTLRQISTRYNVLFNVRKYGKELSPKDFAYQATIGEAAMWGTARTSYQKFGPTKLMIRHCRPVVEGVIGSRGRNILSMFVETTQGERFRFPVNHLSGGRAFAQHINQGGMPHDLMGTSIATLARESLELASVNRYIHHARNILGEEAQSLRPAIKSRVNEIRSSFMSLSRPRGYLKISESGLPLNNLVLEEDQTLEHQISHLASILQINSNHALAESLQPLASLTLGEQMTNFNEVFQGVISLDEGTQDALVEALLDEYGHDSEAFARIDHGIGFMNQDVYEDAQDYLGLMGTQINEAPDQAENPIVQYARKWTTDRFNSSGEQNAMDKDQVKGIQELAMGIADIVGGHVQTPDFPEAAPQFSRMDPTVKDRFYLDLYVGQHKLANSATLNYVSNIIDKIAEGKKLDGIEKAVSSKLIQNLEDDLGEGIVDEGYYDMDPPHSDRDDAKYESALEDIVDRFDVKEFVKDIYPMVLDGDDKEEPLDTKYVMSNLDGHVALEMDAMDFRAERGNFSNEAEELFPVVRDYCQGLGYHFGSVVKEFAETEDQPGHHGISAGDSVSTDMGPGTVISVEGDIAHVEFLHGGTKTLHVDDMDKVPTLGGVAEENDLAEWFNGFDPKTILGEFSSDPYVEGKMARQAGKGKANCPYNAESQDGNAWLRGYHGMSDPMANDIDEDRVDELSSDKVGNYFDKAATDRSRAERKGDDKKLARRDRGLNRAFKKMREDAELDESLGDLNLDEIFDKLKVKAKAVIQQPSKFGLENPDEIYDDQDEAEEEFFRGLQNILTSQLESALYDIRHNEQGVSEDSMSRPAQQPDPRHRNMDDDACAHCGDEDCHGECYDANDMDESLGGDQGEDLIHDTEVDHERGFDEEAQREFETLIKNARFRM